MESSFRPAPGVDFVGIERFDGPRTPLADRLAKAPPEVELEPREPPPRGPFAMPDPALLGPPPASAPPAAPSAVELPPLPSPTTTHAGITGVAGGSWPPDTTGDLDDTWMFEMTNQTVSAYQRSGSTTVSMTLTDWFYEDVSHFDPWPSSARCFDPIALRDPLTGET